MAVTSIGVIFAGQSKLVQRIFIPSGDDSEIAQFVAGPGERKTTMALSVYQNGGVDAVQAAIGAPTFSGRCAVVDATNIVIDLIIADPALYNDARGQVIAHDTAMHGDTWTGTTFTRPFIQYTRATGIVTAIATGPVDSPPFFSTASSAVVSQPPGFSTSVGSKLPGKGE